MSDGKRRARVRAPAKINLALKVLGRRPDGYHELRTVFQTISLADILEIEYTPGHRSGVQLQSNVEIPNNLVVRAAELVMEAARAAGLISMRLTKLIPIGGGLGGGSADAAAVLLALPVLCGRRLPLPALLELGQQLGSDVPFFLFGGTALGLGRGAEVYPLPTVLRGHGVLVKPALQVSTAEAYRWLGRELTVIPPSPIISSFQSSVWCVASGSREGDEEFENDFEEAVFARHPRLRSIKRTLRKLGAAPALMTGSGAAMFGLFKDRKEARSALGCFPKDEVFLFELVSGARYRALWRRWLGAHVMGGSWPPQSRYSR